MKVYKVEVLQLLFDNSWKRLFIISYNGYDAEYCDIMPPLLMDYETAAQIIDVFNDQLAARIVEETDPRLIKDFLSKYIIQLKRQIRELKPEPVEVSHV